jgi:hypothetical protein
MRASARRRSQIKSECGVSTSSESSSVVTKIDLLYQVPVPGRRYHTYVYDATIGPLRYMYRTVCPRSMYLEGPNGMVGYCTGGTVGPTGTPRKWRKMAVSRWRTEDRGAERQKELFEHHIIEEIDEEENIITHSKEN